MVKQIIGTFIIVIFLSSCSTFKPLNFTSNKQLASNSEKTTSANSETKFIDDISVTPKAATVNVSKNQSKSVAAPKKNIVADSKTKTAVPAATSGMSEKSPAIESVSSVKLKYALLMDAEVEHLPDEILLEGVDEWYGVRYRVGGNTKKGIDCSGFTVAVYAAVYGMMLPRVSRDQYKLCRKISTTELQEGDLVFFNTNGRGVSHVGVYLGNNKFMHASVSQGVTVSDLFESYYLKRFVGAGRIDDKRTVSTH